MKAKLPLSTAREVFALSILLLCIMGFFNRWLICRYPLWIASLEFGLPLLVGTAIYKFEYHHRFLEKIFLFLRQGRIYWIVLPLLLSSIGFFLHHQDQLLGFYFPLCFLICVCAAEAESHDNYEQLLSAILLQIPGFLGLSLYLCYNAASALSIIIISYIVLFRVLTYHAHLKRHFWTSLFAATAVILLVCCCLPNILDRLMYLAVSKNDLDVYMACWELFDVGKWFGTAEFTLTSASDLFLHYDLGYLAAKFGFISVIPILSTILVMLVSGGVLCTGFRRPMTTLSIGSYILLILRNLSYIAKSISITIGLGAGLPFFSGSITERIVDLILAVIVLQPLNPKPLLELSEESDIDFDAQELAALILLPQGKKGAAQLAHYVYGKANHLAHTILFREFLKHIGPNDRRLLLMNAAECFHTEEYLREKHPEYYEIASGQQDLLVSNELKTACFDETFIDAPFTYESEGSTLLKYWGSRSELLILPFYTSIADRAFAENNIVEVISVPNMVQKFGYGVFQDCTSLRTVELRNGLEEIGSLCFAGCTNLKSISLPDTLVTLHNDAFANSALETIRIPEGVSAISPYTFVGTPLKEATLTTVKRIENGAFKNCDRLERIIIQDLEYVAPNAFEGCSRLSEIVASAEWLSLHPDLIYRITKFATSEKEGS